MRRAQLAQQSMEQHSIACSVHGLGRTSKLTLSLFRRHSNMMFVDVERRTSIMHTEVEFTMNMHERHCLQRLKWPENTST